MVAEGERLRARSALARRVKPLKAKAALRKKGGNSSSPSFVVLDDHMKRLVGDAVTARHQNRVIVPLFSDVGFMPFLKNLLCSIAQFQVENWVVVSMDNATCGALRATGFAQQAEACVQPYVGDQSLDKGTTDSGRGYGTTHFWRLVVQRPLWVKWLLQEGYSVLQCDVDIVWIHNPLPYFEGPSVQRYNAFLQSEQVFGVNCGFYFVRPANVTISLIQSWMDDMIGPKARHVTHGGKMHEQHSFVRVVKKYKKSSGAFKKLTLNQTEFPNGKIWFNYWQWTSKRTAYILHCNWNTHNKKSRLIRDGLWFLDEGDRRCKAGFDAAAEGCQRNCVPVENGCKVGNPCKYRNCSEQTRFAATAERQSRKELKKRNMSEVWLDRWHPMSYVRAGCV
jgi:hypothetical protein